MKAELRAMIAQPLVARGISVKYLTSGSRSIVDDLVASHGKLHLFHYGDRYLTRTL